MNNAEKDLYDDWTCFCCGFNEKRKGATRQWFGAWINGVDRVVCQRECADRLRRK
jgi:hypothetical protein